MCVIAGNARRISTLGRPRSTWYAHAAMHSILAALGASITTFAVTNIDDAFLVTLFFARRIPTRRIVAGQYIGFAAIVGASLIGAMASLAIPQQWIRWLGVLPIAIGIKQLLQMQRKDMERRTRKDDFSVLSIAFITLANGADNVGIYLPFFVLSRNFLPLVLIAYALLVAGWCYLGRWLGNHEYVLRWVDRRGHWVVPFVFMGAGLYILLR
jgi:cadmium resistance protein CadD (predicted permease)